MYYSLRYHMEEVQLVLVGLFMTKDVVELAVKILDKYTYTEFLKL